MAEETPFEPNITPFRRGTDQFVFLDRARKVRRALRDTDITVLRDQTVPYEPNPVTSASWKHRDTSVHKYIDDSISDTKLDFENEEISEGRTKYV